MAKSSSQSLTMAMDEMDLMNDPKYKTYVKQVDTALKGFEYTSEWADLVNALGKLNKVLQNNTKYPVIPRRFVVGQRLAQCMHPALPSGVHLKALETYDLIFRCIGTDRLVQELSIYSNGLFPLLSHAAINVKPALLEVYQTHFVPLGERLRPALDGFVIAVLPGLEEGADQDMTIRLLAAVCQGVSPEYFYAAIWRCIFNNPSVRLPGIFFVNTQFNKKKSLEDQLHVMGTNMETLVNAICTSLLDPTVLVQRAILDLLIDVFPMHNKQLLKQDMISIITAAVTVLLRRDITLDRRLFAWFRNNLDANPAKPSRKGDYYFDKYSKPLVSQAFVLCLTNPSEVISTPNAWSSLGDLWPYRLLICLVGRKEIRKSILDNLSTEVFRAMYIEFKNECNGSEMQRSTNVLNQMLMTLGIAYTWKRLLQLFSESCENLYRKQRSESSCGALSADSLTGQTSEAVISGNNGSDQNEEFVGVILRKKSRKYSTRVTPSSPSFAASSPSKSFKSLSENAGDERGIQPVGSGQLTILEACSIIDFMIDVTAFANDPETATVHLPLVLSAIVSNLTAYCRELSVDELNSMLRLSSKITAKIQAPANDPESGSGRGTASCEPASDALHEIREETESESIQTIESERSTATSVSIPSSTSTATLTPESDSASTPIGDDVSLKDSLKHEAAAAESEHVSRSASDDPPTTGTRLPVPGEESVVNEQETDVSPHAIVSLIKRLFALFVESRLVTNAISLERLYREIFFTFDSSHGQHAAAADADGLSVDPQMTSVFISLCQLLVQSSLIPQSTTTADASGSLSTGGWGLKSADSQKVRGADPLLAHSLSDTLKSGSRQSNKQAHAVQDPLPQWLRHLLVLCTFSRNSSIAVSCCSISTYLSLVRILKAQLMDVALPHASLVRSSPQTSPVLEFKSHASFSSDGRQSGRTGLIRSDSTSSQGTVKSRSSPTGNLTLAPNAVESLITSSDLEFISRESKFYRTVTESLWDNMSDDNSSLHLETANLIQQIHNMCGEESPVCESVICSAMASLDETISYEARKRFCTLYNITRDIESHSGPLFAPFPRREFDRPLFFMLDSLTHKLDAHNAQAVDWLNHCLKNGDIARILEPLLFILLHPDTARVSVQNVNIHQPEQGIEATNRFVGNGLNSSSSSLRLDEADSAAAAAAEARIYAISSTGGNVMYHVNPDGKKRFAGSPVPTNKVVTVTAQAQGQVPTASSSSSTTSFRNKWVTSRFNVSECEIPPSHENNIIGGKYMPYIHMTMNPFDANGSMSSLASDAMEVEPVLDPGNPAVDFTHTRRFDSLSRKQQPGNSANKATTSADRQQADLSERTTPTRSALNVNFAIPITAPSPSSTPSATPVPDRRLNHRGGDDSESDSEVIANLIDNLVEAVADEMDDESDEESSSSSSTLNTRATISESVSLSSWAKPVSVNQLHSHLLLYSQVYDSNRTLYALTTLWNIILTRPSKVLFSLATTNISNRLGFRSQELQSLCARHRKSLLGKGFYSSLDTESITSFRSSTFLEVIITTCLYYIRSYYPGLSHARLAESDILGNQKVRILSCEILRLIFSELIPEIKGKPAFTSYMNDMLMRCKVQKVVLHSLVSSVYNFQFKDSNGNEEKTDDSFSDGVIDLNEKLSCSTGFQEDMQKSLLKLLEQLMILEHKSSPNSGNDRDVPTHNRKGSDSKASRIRFQPLLSSLKYTPNVAIPCQPMFLSAIQTALQQTSKANLHPNWLQLVESSLPYAGRSLNRMVVCVVIQLCNNLDGLSQTISHIRTADAAFMSSSSAPFIMPPNHLVSMLKSLGNLCHYVLCDSNPSSGSSSPAMSPLPHQAGSASSGSLISVNPIQTISNILHVFSSETLITEQSNQSRESSASDPIMSTRRTLLTHLPRILSSLRNVWKAVTDEPLGSDSAVGRKCWEVMGSSKDVKLAVLDILSPISLLHGSHFMGAVALAWYELRDGKTGTSSSSPSPSASSVIPKCSRNQMILVDLIAAVKVLPMDLIIQHVKQVLRQPPQAAHSRKKRVALEVCLLQFFLAYIRLHATNDRSHQLLECWRSLVSLLKDGLSSSSCQPLAQFHLLAILHEFVQSAPQIDDRKDRKEQKDQRELQDVAQRLVDAVTGVAGARLAQTRWLRRNLEVKPGPQQDTQNDEDTDGELSDSASYKVHTSVPMDGSEGGENLFLSKFSVHALNALAEFVAPILDVVYSSEEKERVVPLVSSIMYFVTPYLKNHSKHNSPSFLAGSHFLSSITRYQYSRKAWRKEAFELLLDPAFFQMEPECLSYWKVIVDNLMTHDKTTFRDFLSRMSVTQSNSLKLFSSKDQENEQRSQLAKRLAFILFCSEKDQYHRYMPEIQEKLIECLRMNSSPIVQSHILLCFRVLLLRMSHIHLTSLWPFIYTEMFQAFLHIEVELSSNSIDFKRSYSGSQLQKLMNSDSSWSSQSNGGLSAPSVRDSAWLQLYLYACKLLDLAIALPADELPQFQMYRWAFVGDPFDDSAPSPSPPTPAASTPDISRNSQILSAGSADRLSIHSLNNNNLSDNRQSMKSPSPSPTPSRTSFGVKSQVSLSPVLPPPSGPFEPHVVRIEKTMKIKNPNPETLTYSERKPLLWLTSIKSLIDLHPFFHTLVRVTNNANLTKSSPEADRMSNGNSANDSRQRPLSQLKQISEEEDPAVAQDRNLESDFLEPIPWI